MKTTATMSLVISFATLALCGAVLAGSDKTLVSWVCLPNTTQQGGSALTICGTFHSSCHYHLLGVG